MRCHKCLTVALALVTLFCLDAYIRWSPLGEPNPVPPLPATTPAPLTTPAPPLPLHHSLQILADIVPRADAYWNRQLHQRLEELGGGNGTRTSASTSATSLGVPDWAAYPEPLQRFVSHGARRHYPLLLEPSWPCPPDGPFLLLAIKSAPGAFAERQAVRQSWGQAGARVRTVFLLGAPDGEGDAPDVSGLVAWESQAHGDVLAWGFHDTFFNLTLKGLLFLGWAGTRCPGAHFVLLGDDDVFVNTPRLLQVLAGLGPGPVYAGHVMAGAWPVRAPGSKYYVPESFYVGPYPAYAGGGGYVFSGVLLGPLQVLARLLPPFPIDDVFTGLCFQALGVAARPHPGFRTFDIAPSDRASPCAHRTLLLVHRRQPLETLRLWRLVHDPQLQC